MVLVLMGLLWMSRLLDPLRSLCEDGAVCGGPAVWAGALSGHISEVYVN